MSQSGYTPIQLYYSTTAAATPSSGNLANGELALNITDGKLFYKDNGGTVQVLATAAGANGDVVGPGSSTDNALVRFDSTTGKLVQNSTAILSDAGALSGLTDISASGSVTLSGGTANGVAYLNGSKVLTSGSALTFDGTNLANAQSTASPTGLILGNSSASTSAGTRVTFQFNGVTTGYVGNQFDGVDFNNQYATNRYHIWLNGGSEQMRLTSTGLGIGTSSPGYKLHVEQATTSPIFKLAYNGTFYATMDYLGSINTVTSSPSDLWQLKRNGTAQVSLDGSGNLGLGVTPSAWGSSLRAFQVGYASMAGYAGTGGTTLWLNGNAYFNGSSWVYQSSTYASQYQQYQGQHQWLTAPSGTAGNAISFTQAMTLDASGNLGLGTTNPTAISGYTAFEVNGNSSGSIIDLAQNDVMRGRLVAVTGSFTLETSGSIPILFAPGGTERARIDSSGNFGIGTSSPGYKLAVAGTIAAGISANTNGRFRSFNGSNDKFVEVFSDGTNAIINSTYSSTSAGPLLLQVGDTTRVTIDSSGNLGLGVTPSAWGTAFAYRAIDIGLGSALANMASTTTTDLISNAYYNGSNWLYKNTAAASKYRQSGGAHSWDVASSGTAGNAISFTQAMTLDTDNSLRVGPSGSYNFWLQQGSSQNTFYSYNNGSDHVMAFRGSQYKWFIASGSTQAMTLDASGNLGVGTTSPSTQLHVNSAADTTVTIDSGGTAYASVVSFVADSERAKIIGGYQSGGGGYLAFNTDSTGGSDVERARIDSSGNWYCVGVYNTTSGSGANVGVNSAGLFYRSTSSLKYKKDVQDAAYGLTEVMRLRPVTYKSKAEADGDKVFGGLIAEEVHEAGLTEFVQYAEDGSPDALTYSNMVSLCIKAIQEQQTIINQLKARLDAANL